MNKQAILILGMHRSGTSMLAGLLNHNGYDIGPDVMPAHPDNPKGFFENNTICALNERILSEMGSCWDDLTIDIVKKAELIRERYLPDIKDVIEDQFSLVDRFLIKDPRICLLYPAWAAALREVGIENRVVIPYRQPLEVAYSLKKRNKFPLNKGLLLWCNHLLYAEYLTRADTRAFISYNGLLQDPASHLQALLKAIDCMPPEGSNIDTAFTDSQLAHHRVSYDNISQSLPTPVLELITLVRNADFTNTTALDEIRGKIDSYRDFFIDQETQYSTRNQKTEQQLKNQVDRLQANLQEKQHQFNQKSNEANGLRNQLQQKTQELGQVRQNHQGVLAERQKEIQGLKNQLEQAKKQLAEANNKIEALQQKPPRPAPEPQAGAQPAKSPVEDTTITQAAK